MIVPLMRGRRERRSSIRARHGRRLRAQDGSRHTLHHCRVICWFAAGALGRHIADKGVHEMKRRAIDPGARSAGSASNGPNCQGVVPSSQAGWSGWTKVVSCQFAISCRKAGASLYPW
jgi:hypothetical protein